MAEAKQEPSFSFEAMQATFEAVKKIHEATMDASTSELETILYMALQPRRLAFCQGCGHLKEDCVHDAVFPTGSKDFSNTRVLCKQCAKFCDCCKRYIQSNLPIAVNHWCAGSVPGVVACRCSSVIDSRDY